MTITTKYNVGDTVWSAWPSGDFTQYTIRRIDYTELSESAPELDYFVSGQTRRFAESELFPTLADCWNDLARKHEELAATYRANAEKAETEQADSENAFEYLKQHGSKATYNIQLTNQPLKKSKPTTNTGCLSSTGPIWLIPG